jgi:hypothetical protein
MYRDYLLESINEILQTADEKKLEVILAFVEHYAGTISRP